MPRPCKRRRVCALPERRSFRSAGDPTPCRETIHMTVDEFETLRLMDLEGLSQAECARQMEVSRATVQAIYGAARSKVASFLVRGGELTIGGGAFTLCPGGKPGCPRCHRHCHEGGNSCEKDRGDL
ncbi:DUF134 domain-containing protein [Intestinimonas sp.]|uniref:DUF134 domain-containing protein n=1 Tax=Intestinimonas sp. TaxID=1965293 RepID=UPI00263874AD|nr:DUF134 domain-containing protein [Intestinimonas sp.]